MLPLARTFCFDHVTVENLIDARIKSTAIRRQTICRETLIRNVPYWKRVIADVFKVLQSCDAGRLAQTFCHRSFVSTMSSCHKAPAVVRTSS